MGPHENKRKEKRREGQNFYVRVQKWKNTYSEAERKREREREDGEGARLRIAVEGGGGWCLIWALRGCLFVCLFFVSLP